MIFSIQSPALASMMQSFYTADNGNILIPPHESTHCPQAYLREFDLGDMLLSQLFGNKNNSTGDDGTYVQPHGPE